MEPQTHGLLREGLRDNELRQKLKVSKSTLFDLRKNDPTFPRPVKLGARVNFTYLDELVTWLNAQTAKRDVVQGGK